MSSDGILKLYKGLINLKSSESLRLMSGIGINHNVKNPSVNECTSDNVIQCDVEDCEYNNPNGCYYCGDYFTPNDKNCISYIDKYEGL